MNWLEAPLNVILAVILVFLAFAPYPIIVGKAGFSRWWGLLALVPLVVCVAVAYLWGEDSATRLLALTPFVYYTGLIIFALIEWPVARELACLRRLEEFRKDREISADWELKAILRKAIDLEKQGKYDEAIREFERFIEKTQLDQNVELARSHIAAIRERQSGPADS